MSMESGSVGVVVSLADVGAESGLQTIYPFNYESASYGVSTNPRIAGLQNLGGRNFFRPPEKNELVLSIETGCTDNAPFPREPNTPF